MGEAKRRRQLDPNFGNPAYSRYGKAVYQHHQAPEPPFRTASVEAYEQHAKRVVANDRTTLLQLAQAARNRLSSQHKEESLCLFILRTFDETKAMRMKFERISKVKRLWTELLQNIGIPSSDVDLWFDEISAKCTSTEFIWAHPDITTSGFTARLVPIEDADIADVCRSRAV